MDAFEGAREINGRSGINGRSASLQSCRRPELWRAFESAAGELVGARLSGAQATSDFARAKLARPWTAFEHRPGSSCRSRRAYVGLCRCSVALADRRMRDRWARHLDHGGSNIPLGHDSRGHTSRPALLSLEVSHDERAGAAC
jgi:hypothetical protein